MQHKETFADRLRRLSEGINRAELCARAGIASSTFFDLLAGKTEPKLGTLVSLASALGRNLDVWDGLAPSPQEKRRQRKKQRPS